MTIKIHTIISILTLIIFVSTGIGIREGYLHKHGQIVYENLLHNQPYYTQERLSKKERKKIPKHIRPKPNAEFEKIKTMDPALGRVPQERLFNALKETERRLGNNQGSSYRDSLVWEEQGPANVAGRTRAIMFDPNDPDQKRFWAGGITGGLWFTNDITASAPVWYKIDDLWANLAISSIVYDPTNTNIFYAGTGEIYANASRGFGIWKSEDGGDSWYHLSSTENFYYVNDMVVRDENNQGVLYAGTGMNYYEGEWHSGAHGLYRSVNQGASFTQVLPEVAPNNQPYQPSDLEIGSDNTLWVGTRRNAWWDGAGTILKSTDGLNWNVVYENINAKRVELAVAPSDPGAVFAVGNSVEYSDNDIGFFIKTNNSGISWANISIPLNENNVHFTRGQAWYDLILAVDPVTSSTLYVGGIDLHKSTDSGTSWTQISQWYGYPYSYVHADQHCISFRPNYPQEFAVGNDGGIHYSTDGGSTFENFNNNYSLKNNGYNVTQFYALAIHPDENSNQFLAGSQDNGTQYFDEPGLENTYEISGGDGAWCFFNETDPAYRITSYVYNNYYLFHNLNYQYKILSDSETGHFINPTDFDSDNDILYSSKSRTSLTRVFNVTSTPERNDINGLSLGSLASCVKISPYDAGYLLVGTDAGRLFEISNANSNSPVVNEITSASFPQGYLSSIEFGQSEDQILLTFSNYGIPSIWNSNDGTQSWVNLDGDLPDMPIRWAIYHPEDQNSIIAATEIGIWICDDVNANSIQWYPNNGSLANVRVDMLRVRESDKLIAAATYGRGLFTTTLSAPQTSILNESVPGTYKLAQNFPNPFNPSTIIQYELPRESQVKLDIFDVKGIYIRSLIDNKEAAGTHNVQWNSRDRQGRKVPNGVYFYTITTNDFTQMKKMIFIK